MSIKLQKLVIVDKIDLETIKKDSIDFSIDLFTEAYNVLERKIQTEILVKFFEIKNPNELDYIDFKFRILPNYTRVISYKNQDLGVINLIFEPLNSVFLPILVEFKPF